MEPSETVDEDDEDDFDYSVGFIPFHCCSLHICTNHITEDSQNDFGYL